MGYGRLGQGVIPRRAPSMAHGGCKWGQKNFEINVLNIFKKYFVKNMVLNLLE
jgi:hypothetical protein